MTTSDHLRAPTSEASIVRKTVQTLAFVPKSQRISMLARKVYNVMLYIAQRQGFDQPLYSAQLKEIVDGIDFNSRNIDVIKNHLRSLMNARVEWQSPTQGEGATWSLSGLLAHTDLIVRRGELTLEWSYGVNIKKELLDPIRFAKISLFHQAALRSGPALVLYEICCRYRDNPGKLTARNPWVWWRPVLTSTPDHELEAYKEYKYFKRDVLKNAIAEVNSTTDLTIELIEHKKGRCVEDLQFRVEVKGQKRLPSENAPEPVDLRLIGEAIKLGIRQEVAEKLLHNFGASTLKQGLKQLTERRARTGMEPLRDVEKFLNTILKNHPVASPKLSPHQAAEKLKSVRIKLIETYRAAKVEELLSMFQEMTDEGREEVMTRFETDALPTMPPMVQRAYERKKLTSPLVRSGFIEYLATETWGDQWNQPTDAELLEISLLDAK